MIEKKKYKGIALSAIPYTVAYLTKIALRFKSEGYDGVCLVCGELFPWSSPSKLSAVLYYSEQEIAGFAAFCSKAGIECITALDTSDLPTILYSLKGYEKFCAMEEEDQSVFTGKMLPELIEDICALLPEGKTLVFADNIKISLINEVKECGPETEFLTESVRKDNYIVWKSESCTVDIWKSFSGETEEISRILYPGDAVIPENTREDEYRKLCSGFSGLNEKIMTADSHSRTGCSHPLAFWKGCLESAECLEEEISVSFEKLAGEISSYVNGCWLDGWVFSRNSYYRDKAAELKNICRQHIWFFQKH